MWTGFLTLAALAVIFVVLLKLLERSAEKRKAERQAKPPRDEEEREERDEAGDDEGAEAPVEARLSGLIETLVHGTAAEARLASQQLMMSGPRAIHALLAVFLEAEKGRADRSTAVVAARVEETLAMFGPPCVRPCLEVMAAEKGRFEIHRGVRRVLRGVGDGAARPLLESMPWLVDEGLYVRAALLLRALGPGALSPLMRAIEGGEGRSREIATDLLLDVAPSLGAAVRERLREAFLGARRGVLASVDVRLSLLAAVRRIPEGPFCELEALRAAARDEAPRVRREAWLLVAQEAAQAEGTAREEGRRLVSSSPIDGEGSVAAAQIYAHAAWGFSVSGAVTSDPRVRLALRAVDARVGDAAAAMELERALGEGALELRREAIDALAFAGNEDAGRSLAKGLLHAPVPLVGAVAQALGRTPPQAASAALFDLWEERGGNAVRRGIAALGGAAVPKLMDYVARRNPRLMEGAAFVLGTLGEPARAPLLALLRDARPEDPALFAVEVALELHGREAVPDLLPLLDGAGHVREMVAWIVAQTDAAEAAEPLLAHLEGLADRAPVLDYVSRGGPEIRERTRAFVEAHPEHKDAAAIREVIGG